MVSLSAAVSSRGTNTVHCKIVNTSATFHILLWNSDKLQCDLLGFFARGIGDSRRMLCLQNVLEINI